MFLILIFLTIVLAVVYFLSVNRNYWKQRNVVEVKYAAWEFILGKCALPEVYKKVYDAFPNENYVGMYLGPKPILVLKNVEDIQAILSSDFQSFYSRGYNVNVKEILADNLLLINDYPRWKMVRQKMSPIFTKLKMKNMYRAIYRSSLDLVEYMNKWNISNQGCLNVLNRYNFIAIGAAIFGLDFGTENSVESPIVDKACSSADTHFMFTLKMAICNSFPKFFSFFNMKTFGDHMDFVLQIIKQVLKDRREMRGKRQDYIDMCLDIQKEETIQDDITGCELKTTDEFIATQAFSIFVAGVETSGNTMNYTLLELANNQEILEKVHKEIDAVFNSTSDLSYNDVDNLKYLDMVISESLRKYPPIGCMQRETTQDTILPTKLKIEKGTTIIIPVYALHMDGRFFEKPEKFNPERFSSINKDKINKYAYLPFSEGNRICIGAAYARLQMKTALACLLREFTLKTCMYEVKHFEPSIFTLRDSKIKYELVRRR